MLELEEPIVGRYRLRHRLGRGGMSDVYLATDEHQQREVAIKLVNRSHGEYSERFQREVATMRTLTHPHILPALDSGQHGPWSYMVMPYIKHGTLRERLLKGPLTLEEVGEILEQLADALQFAHDLGIVHRDIKPSNILLQGEWYVYLADFGLAKATEDDNNITQSGCLIGTPEYIAPELIDRPASKSSDVYAVGVVLYEMLTGRVPYKAATPIATCWKHISEQPVRPSLLNPAISLDVEQVILCALEKDPRRRFKSPRALVRAYKSSLQSVEQPETLPEISLAPVFALPARPELARATVKVVLLQEILSRYSGGAYKWIKELPQAALRRGYRLPHTYKSAAAFTAFASLLVLSLVLGIFAAGSSMPSQVPTTLGVGASFVGGSALQQKHLVPTSTPTPTRAARTSKAPAGEKGDNGEGHGHKPPGPPNIKPPGDHGHGHKPPGPPNIKPPGDHGHGHGGGAVGA